MSKTRAERTAEEAQVMAFLQARAADQGVANKNTQNRRTTTSMAKDQLFLQQFEDMAKRIFKDKVVPSKYSQAPHKEKKTRILNLLLSDLHYGADLDGREVPHQYGPLEEARRTAAIVLQAADYKRQYRDVTKLFIHVLGDVIQGQLGHIPSDGAPLAEQVARAMRMLIQSVVFLSSQFPEVVVRCTAGNHSRNIMKHPTRATTERWDNFETMVYVGLKEAVAHIPNVTVEIPYTPYYTYEAFGSQALMVHGDTIIKPGYPGKSINIESIKKQLNELNVSSESNYGLVAVGHVHVGSITHLPNGTVFMTNGCLIPIDPYALSIGIFSDACGQWLFESVQGYLVGDHRFITVNETTDKDKTLDKIIKPFSAF